MKTIYSHFLKLLTSILEKISLENIYCLMLIMHALLLIYGFPEIYLKDWIINQDLLNLLDNEVESKSTH